MKRRQVAVTVALAVCAVALVAVPVVGLGVAPGAQVDNASSDNTTNGSFGQQVSSFMQASAADADSSVERGMWQASVNQTVNESGDPAPKVAGRVAALERRLQELQNRTEQLRAERRNLSSNRQVAYTARASALREQIVNLREDINATERTAMRVGVDASSLDRVRAAAGNATGPEVAAIARSITDAPRGPPAGVPGGGPPGDRGPGGVDPANGTTGPGPGNAGPPGRDSGPAAGGPGNATTGPGPADSGPGVPGQPGTDNQTNATSGGGAPDETGGGAPDTRRGGRPDDRGGQSDSAGDPAAPDGSP
ncbi:MULTISPECIES: hypothetical protein [Salinibaculum]|uniref:hypothetical protein n=1 Tax=Salinibaculum TaxID=2732368 RepID=UPI0030D35D32